jgi:diguanylate cyclase (GGDEF)-like protein
MTSPERVQSALQGLTTPVVLRDRAAVVTEALRAACALTSAQASSLTLLEGRSPSRHVFIEGRELPSRAAPKISEGLVRATLLEGRPLFLSDPAHDLRYVAADTPPDIRVRNVASALVQVRLQNMGVIACYNLPPGMAEPAVAGSTLAILGACAGLAIENARLTQSLQRVAVTDDLTQVYNYRFLRTALRREMKRATRSRHPFSLLMVDVDHLKEYNDRFGHLRGSRLLRDLARVISRKVRGMDLVAKYGGDEFTVILPETPRAGGLAVAERIRAAVATHAFHRCKAGEMTVSLGMAVFPDDGIQPATLIAAADTALYAAKQRGRNQVVEASGLILPGLACA